MKLKTYALIGSLTAGLLLSQIPLVPAALADTTLSVAPAGSSVSAQGQYKEGDVPLGGAPVFLTVTGPEAVVYYADQGTTDANGRYRFQWTMPNEAPEGSYSVNVHVQGDDQTSTFSYSPGTSFQGPFPTAAMTPYRFTGELNSGKRQAVIPSKDAGLTYGSPVGGKLSVGLESYKAQNAVALASSDTNYLTLSIPTRDTDVEVAVPGSVIRSMQSNFDDDAHLLVAAEAGSYDLPLQAVNSVLLDGVKNAANGTLNIRIHRLNDYDAQALNVARQASSLGASRLKSPVDFSVAAVYNGQTLPVKDYGNQYARYSIDLAGTEPASSSTQSALFLHPASNALMTTPSRLYRDSVGHGKLVISRPGNGLYVPVETHRTFVDLPSYPAYAKEKVEKLASKYVILGRSSTEFDPNGKINRAEFATLMIRALGLAEKTGTSHFYDVQNGQWYTDTVNIGASLSLINGYSSYQFAPFDSISREQLVTLISRSMQYVKAKPYVDTTRVLGPLTDRSDISDWARDDVAMAMQTGILPLSVNRFNPKDNATRQFAAEMLYNMLGYLQLD
jgi:hypothetical protein